MLGSRNIRSSGKVLRDPVHRLIRIDSDDEYILDLIDTPEFQRLRRIRQLGVSSLTYPGAEHSRFSHSIGVFNFAQRILEALKQRYRGEGEAFDYLKKHQKTVKAAALLHDIGHGPFSHVVERAFDTKKAHELKTAQIIRDDSSSVGRVLNTHGIAADDVASIIDESTPHFLLKDIVSSQLDADRMDYLLRDSHFAGVAYGAYDPEWLLNSMCIGLDPNASHTDAPNRWRLCLDKDRGLYAAEQFILARSHMNSQVYFHRVTRGYEVMLLTLLANAAKHFDALSTHTPPVILQFLRDKTVADGSAWLAFDEASFLTAFHAWAGDEQTDKSVRGLARAILERKRLLSSRNAYQLKGLQFTAVESALTESRLLQQTDWEWDDLEWTPYKGMMRSARLSKDDEESSAESILLSGSFPNERAKPLDSESDLARSLDDKREISIRLYYDRTKEKEFESVLREFDFAD